MTKAVKYALRIAKECSKRKPLVEADKKRQRLNDASNIIRKE